MWGQERFLSAESWGTCETANFNHEFVCKQKVHVEIDENSTIAIQPPSRICYRKSSMWLARGASRLGRLPISIVNLPASSQFTLKYGRC